MKPNLKNKISQQLFKQYIYETKAKDMNFNLIKLLSINFDAIPQELCSKSLNVEWAPLLYYTIHSFNIWAKIQEK